MPTTSGASESANGRNLVQPRCKAGATECGSSHNAYTRAYFSRAILGPWGSLVYPWWFGTTRLRFKSGRTHYGRGNQSAPLHRRLPRPQPTRNRTPSARSVIILLGRPAVSNVGEVGRLSQTIPRPRACPGAKRDHSRVLVRGESSGGNPRRGSSVPGWRPGRAAFHSESRSHGSSGRLASDALGSG